MKFIINLSRSNPQRQIAKDAMVALNKKLKTLHLNYLVTKLDKNHEYWKSCLSTVYGEVFEHSPNASDFISLKEFYGFIHVLLCELIHIHYKQHVVTYDFATKVFNFQSDPNGVIVRYGLKRRAVFAAIIPFFPTPVGPDKAICDTFFQKFIVTMNPHDLVSKREFMKLFVDLFLDEGYSEKKIFNTLQKYLHFKPTEIKGQQYLYGIRVKKT